MNYASLDEKKNIKFHLNCRGFFNLKYLDFFFPIRENNIAWFCFSFSIVTELKPQLYEQLYYQFLYLLYLNLGGYYLE